MTKNKTDESLAELAHKTAKVMVEALSKDDIRAGDFMAAMTLANILVIRSVSEHSMNKTDDIIDLFCENLKKYKGIEQ